MAKQTLAALLLTGALLATPSAQAQETRNRCLLLGPLAISSFIATLEQVARSNRADGAPHQVASENLLQYSRAQPFLLVLPQYLLKPMKTRIQRQVMARI